MEYRKYLTNNSNNIIKENQVSANAYCSNTFLPIDNQNTLSNPIVFKFISDPSPYNSDLKLNYLNDYVKTAELFTPGIIRN